MYGIIIYLLQSGACLAGFYFVYKLFLSRETLHRFNRMLLLSVIAVSAALPLCRITVERELPVAAANTVVNIAEIAEEPTSAEKTLNGETILCIVFSLGMATAVARLAFSIASVRRVIASGTTSTTADGIDLTIVGDDTKPFSWMNHIVISAKDAGEDGRIIIAHETAHIRLRHSWDIMAVDIVGCLQWFNPALWLLRRELQSLHEYEADDAVLASGINIKEYQMLLIKKAVGGRLQTIANCLNHSKLKNRITMMLQKPSSRWSAGKALLMLPLVGLSLGAFARTVYVLPQEQDKIMQNSSNLQIAEVENRTDTLPVKVIRIAGNDAAQTEKRVRTVIVKGATDAVYPDGKKLDLKELEKLNDLPDFKEVGELNDMPKFSGTEFAAQIILNGKTITAEELGKVASSQIDNIVVDKSSGVSVIRVMTKDDAATVGNGDNAQTVQSIAFVTKTNHSPKIIVNSSVGDYAAAQGVTKIILNGKDVSSDEFDKFAKTNSSQIDNIVIDKSSDENVMRVTTKFDPADYSQLQNAEVRVNGKSVKTSSLKTLDSNCITNVNIDKREGKTAIDISTTDGKWVKKQKSKKK